MRKTLQFIKNKLSFMVAIMTAAVIGGVTTAFVQAAIPSSTGIISGCRSNLTGVLRVIDTEDSETCATGETAVDWHEGENTALIHILFTNDPGQGQDRSLDTARSTHIVSFWDSPADEGSCLQTDFTPKFIMGSFSDMEIKDANGWTDGEDGPAETLCGGIEGANVYIPSSWNTDYFAIIH